MHRLAPILATVTLSAAVLQCGCQSNSQQFAMEEESRRQAQTIRELRSQVTETEKLLTEQDQEIQALRETRSQKRLDPGISASRITSVSLAEEARVNWGSVASLRIHRLTSGLVAGEDSAGQSLHVVLQPLDADGELTKVAGDLSVSVTLVGAEGSAEPVASQAWSITESRKLWTRGLVSSGFHLRIPLAEMEAFADKSPPLLVTATLDLGGDRKYSTTELLNDR